ncbi:phosphoserine phosphatase SerB [Roseomonas haemaphysalidis]|uniref:Phosphoserine phosphatase n=1 Tax=Roseomonas haemaphysalidis TaxID=2768162 RepID=A0ABS3KTQ1_9PROT|nr:phosphoserine phosphatase SerB [Roseomonas haemaphysalidis]MBO1080843.1 phosphoserine phosphatase SerB [Roseomonas haemaphysalidis]
MSHIMTLVAPAGGLQAPLVARIRAALNDLGGQAGTADWLAEEEAADLPFSLLAAEQATAIARGALDGAPVDCIAQPAEGRRKMLLVADMDSTIVTAETLDELAAHAGVQAQIAAITQRSMNGEIDFSTSLRERVAMIKGLPLAALQKTWEHIELMPGAEELVRTMAAHGAHCAIASGGFTWFTARVAERVGFQSHHANILLDDGHALLGRVEEPVFDRDSKLTILKQLAAEHALPLSATAAVGDGANDLAMLGAAGLGVAFRAKPVVAASARARVDFGDLRALLFAQGFRAAEIVEQA